MSSTQVTEASKPLCLSVRVIEAKMYKNFGSLRSPKVNLRLGSQTWLSSAATGNRKNLRWEQFHSFEIIDSYALSISLVSTPLFLSPKCIGMCSLKIPIENLKCTNWYELEEQGTVVAKVLISYLIDEKGEISNHSRTLHNLDLQREQVRYLKKKYLQKLDGVKVEKKEFRRNASSFLNKVREQFENSVSFQKIAKERMDVQMEIMKLKEEHSNIKIN